MPSPSSGAALVGSIDSFCSSIKKSYRSNPCQSVFSPEKLGDGGSLARLMSAIVKDNATMADGFRPHRKFIDANFRQVYGPTLVQAIPAFGDTTQPSASLQSHSRPARQ